MMEIAIMNDYMMQNAIAQMELNQTHVLSVSRDYTASGKKYWRLFHGADKDSGFEIGRYTTRRDSLECALSILDQFKDHKWRPIVAFEHGWRVYRWLDRGYYFATGKIRSH